MRREDSERLALESALQFDRRKLLVAGGASALFLAGMGGTSELAAADSTAGGGKEVAQMNWGIVADPVLLDPLGPNDYQSVQPMYQCFDTILQLNAKNGISPMIASAWKQPDPKTYIYTIRSGVTFQDGSPMTVDDVAYSISRHVDPKNGSALADFVKSVKSVETNAKNQVIVRLKEPDAMWKYIPCLPVGMVVSKKNIEKLKAGGKKIGSPSALPLGTGPYRYKSWERGQAVNMERYDGYWDKSRALKVKKLVFRVIADAEALATGLIDGSVHGTFQLNGSSMKPLEGKVQILRSPSVNIRIAATNCTKPPFNDRRVRQALSLATDKNGLLQSAYAGEGRLWNSPVMSDQWQFSKGIFAGAAKALPDFAKQDMDKAKKLIEAAGAKGASGNIIASSTEQRAQAVAIQQSAKEIGLNLSIDTMSGDEFIAQLFPAKQPGKWSVACWDWGSDTPDPSSDLLIPFLSTNASDFTGYRNPRIDKLLLKQRGMADGPARARVLTQIQSTIVAEQAWSVLYWITQLTALSKDLGGLKVIPTWAYQHWAADVSGN